MVILVSGLCGVSLTCVLYLVLYQRSHRQLVLQRISGVSSVSGVSDGAAFPYKIYNQTRDMLTAQNSKSMISRELYLAGMRSKKQVGFFYLFVKLGIGLPVLVILVALLNSSLSLETAKNAVMIGGGIFLMGYFKVRMARIKRQKSILKDLPQFLDLLVVCVEAGLGFTAAMERVLNEADPGRPLSQEFKVMHGEFLSGLSLAEACDRLDKRCEVPDLTILLGSIVQSDQMGASLGGSLRVQAHDLRDKYRQRLRTRAHKIPVKILFPTLLIFVQIFIITLGPAFYQMKELFGAKT